ncbi:MAG: STAS domain-containing protein [Pseudomonadota bacterium]|nr:STAS domain-containing protein [Pseudomonadota bacterium]
MSEAAHFQLDTATAGVLAVSGVLSFETAGSALGEIQLALGDGAIGRLDLAGVSRADSAGLACIVAVVAEADRSGRILQVIRMPAGMQALAQVCEVERLLA